MTELQSKWDAASHFEVLRVIVFWICDAQLLLAFFQPFPIPVSPV
jgi:hypothetical protein